MEFLSPLRYPGGKAKVADFVQCLIKENALLDGTYVEPYVGGGSVALSLLRTAYQISLRIHGVDRTDAWSHPTELLFPCSLMNMLVIYI